MPGIGNRVKKKSKPPDQTKQSQRFIETAKALKVDESGKEFDRALSAIIAPAPKPSKRIRQTK